MLRGFGVLLFLLPLPAALLAGWPAVYGLVPMILGWLLASTPARQPKYDREGNRIVGGGLVFRWILPLVGVVAFVVGVFMLLFSESLLGLLVMAIASVVAIGLPHLQAGATAGSGGAGAADGSGAWGGAEASGGGDGGG
jgi:hypothetical protein